MRTIHVDSTPDITDNQVQVITSSPNLSTLDIEQFVTYPVELAMSNLPGVEDIRSVSRFGLSVVTVVFREDMGTYRPRQLVKEKLDEVEEQIPEGFGKPEMGPITTGLGEIYQYTLVPKDTAKYSPQELRTMQDWVIKRQLAMIPGVVDVNSFGGSIKQYEIALSSEQLNSRHVSMQEVFEALSKNNVNTGGAYIEKDHMASFIRGEGLVKSIDDIKNIVVKNEEGVPVLISDVAEDVRFGHQVRYGAFTQNGHEAVGGMILMLKNANSDQVVKAVKARIEEVQKSLPADIQCQIKEVAEAACKSVGLDKGPAHVEMKVTLRGPVMIELGARMGGDNITTHLVPLSTGIDMVGSTIKVALGENPDITPTLHCGSAIRYFEVPFGTIKAIEGIEEAKKIPGVKQITFTKVIGEKTTAIQCSNDRIGFVIAQGETAEKAVEACENVMKIIKITIE